MQDTLQLVLSAVAMLAGAGLLGYGLASLIRGRAERGWCRTAARFGNLSVGIHRQVVRYGVVEYYFPKVDYWYELGGARYQSSTISRDRPSIWQEQDETAAWELGRALVEQGLAYVRPGHPEQSTLLPGLSRSRTRHFISISLGGATVVAVSTFVLVTGNM